MDSPGIHIVESVQMFALNDYMLVNAETLASLQIFQSELSPNSQIWGPKRSAPSSCEREGLSIYGLFHTLAATQQGKAKLRRMFSSPLRNLAIIRKRQQAIAVLLRPDNAETLTYLHQNLKKICDLRKTICRLQKGSESNSDRGAMDRSVWWTLARFALHALQLRNWILRLNSPPDFELQNMMVNAISVSTMKEIGERIDSVVDFEETKLGSRAAVKWGLNEELDILKRDYNGLEGLLNQVCLDIARQVPEWATKYISGCLFWPQMGFLTAVPVDAEMGGPTYEGQGLSNDDWQQMLVADDKVYFKNRRMRELDDYMGDIYGRILGQFAFHHLKNGYMLTLLGLDLQIDILHRLSQFVLRYEHELVSASDACGELDSMVTLALGAEKYHWSPPKLTTSNVIDIRESRHPLQELVVPSFIPNDCCLVGGPGTKTENAIETPDGSSGSMPREQSIDDSDRPGMIVLTGPNHSGKSVYLKQVALITYLAHIGSHVPAQTAVIGLTDQILTRISTRESVTQNESAFAIDLRQVSFCLRAARRRSLVVIDEFGKGTRADDGAGLMTALLGHFSSLGSEAPRVIAATHFHEIFESNYLQQNLDLALAHMDVRLDLEAEKQTDVLTYLYKMVPGRSSSSFGSRCAAINGVDEAVVDRADAIALLLARNEDLTSACAKLDAQDQFRLERAESVARRFLRLQLSDLASGVAEQDGGPVKDLLESVLDEDMLATR